MQFTRPVLSICAALAVLSIIMSVLAIAVSSSRDDVDCRCSHTTISPTQLLVIREIANGHESICSQILHILDRLDKLEAVK